MKAQQAKDIEEKPFTTHGRQTISVTKNRPPKDTNNKGILCVHVCAHSSSLVSNYVKMMQKPDQIL